MGNNRLRTQTVPPLVNTLFQHGASPDQVETSDNGSSVPHKLVF